MHLVCPTKNQENNFSSVHRIEVSNQGLVRLRPNYLWSPVRKKVIPSYCKGSLHFYKWEDMPPNLNRFKVGLFNKVKKTRKRCSTAGEHKTYKLCSWGKQETEVNPNEVYRDLEGQFATGNCKWKVWDYNEGWKLQSQLQSSKKTLPKHLNAKTLIQTGLVLLLQRKVRVCATTLFIPYLCLL